MAKNNKQAKRMRPARKRAQVPQRIQRGLDQYATDYLKLLVDPCQGALAHACYPGGSGGILTRFESDFILNDTATDKGTAVAFVPGFNSEAGGLNGGMLMVNSTPITTDTQVLTFANSTAGPGYTFLANNAKAFRCVAACLQISYPGSELSRAGIVGIGQTTLSNFLSGAVTPSNLRVLAQHVGRMPDDMLEVKLRPNEASEKWCDPTLSVALATTQAAWGDTPALFATVFGIPVSTGVRIRCVTVVEWLPATATGVNSNPASAPLSRNTQTEVLQIADRIFNNSYVRKGAELAIAYGANYLSRKGRAFPVPRLEL